MSEKPSCAPWNNDAAEDVPVIEERLYTLLYSLATTASDRVTPTVDIARGWHRQIHEGLHLPVTYYAGEIRDSDPRFPCLWGYEVKVGNMLGAPSTQVPSQLAFLETAMQDAVTILDGVIPVGEPPADTTQLREVLALGAAVHGEWVRIHPFANGNGRIARLWANWCALRYGLPPFLRLRPRPAHSGYANAAAASMQGFHEPMERVFLDLLLSPPPPSGR